MKRHHQQTKISMAVIDKVLSFLAGAFEWNQRVALGMIDPFKYEKYLYYQRIREENEEKKKERRRARQALSVLDRAGFVIQDGNKYHLTPSGWLRFARVYSKTIKRLKRGPHVRLKRNMIVMFDIPEKQKSLRNTLRRLLYSLGFLMYQRSVFIGDNPESFEIVSKIISNADVGDQVKLMVVDRIM